MYDIAPQEQTLRLLEELYEEFGAQGYDRLGRVMGGQYPIAKAVLDLAEELHFAAARREDRFS